jgi:RNA polymerase sigma factor (sigma-70 family)
MKDNIMIRAFRSGENWAFSLIHAKYAKNILAFVLRHVRDRSIAEDLTQEVFLRLFRFRRYYRPGHAFSSWLWTIARNVVSDWFRKASNREPAHSAHEGNEFHPEQIPSHHPCAESLLERKTQRQQLVTVMKQLTKLQRRVLRMRIIKQLSYDEIAKKLGLSLSAVKCLLYRSKQAVSTIRLMIRT